MNAARIWLLEGTFLQFFKLSAQIWINARPELLAKRAEIEGNSSNASFKMLDIAKARLSVAVAALVCVWV
ncbi:MAG: hypothetical protein HKP37_03645 [Boseongicola sp.]|nr:hypothetical protein [Boseongicola sp.]